MSHSPFRGLLDVLAQLLVFACANSESPHFDDYSMKMPRPSAVLLEIKLTV